jgi:hypothetical protein
MGMAVGEGFPIWCSRGLRSGCFKLEQAFSQRAGVVRSELRWVLTCFLRGHETSTHFFSFKKFSNNNFTMRFGDCAFVERRTCVCERGASSG